jgi:hypothetical protein
MLPEQDPPEEFEQLEFFFIFCLVWSLGGSLVEEDREKFSEFLRNTSQLILPSSLFMTTSSTLKTINS